MVGLYLHTLKALLAPKRLLPVAFVSFALIIAQRAFSFDDMEAIVAAWVCGLFWLVSPFAYRALFHYRRTRLSEQPSGIRAVALGIGFLVLSAACVWTSVVLVPDLLGAGPTFLSHPAALGMEVALFAGGGFGLGRDIEHESLLAAAERRERELEKQAEQAQLLALKSHLDPHFLFNTLNAIAEWCRQDGEVAEQATLELSAMLRTILSGVKETQWPLAKELELAKSFFSLHRIRDPERFDVEFDLPEPLPQVMVPPMVLLPVIENAVKHGPASGHSGPIHVRVSSAGTKLQLVVENAGDFLGPRAGGEGLGIVRQRVEVFDPDNGSFSIEGLEGRTRATISLSAGQLR